MQKEQIHFKVIDDIHEAKSFWEMFSPQKTIHDDWNFRYAFYKYLNFPLYFIVGYHDDKPIGLLPLQRNTRRGHMPKGFKTKESFLEFFGGDDTDDNQVFINPHYKHLTKLFYDYIPSTAILAPLADPLLKTQSAEFYTHKFTAKLQGIPTFKEFMSEYFDEKTQQRLVSRMNRLYKNHRINIIHGSEEDLPLLFDFNQERFGDDSSFNWQYRQQIFRDLMNYFPVDLITIKIDGKIKAVSYSILYKDTYVSMNIGYDYAIPDLSKLLVISQLQRAIEKNCTTLDAGKGDSEWKKHFHLQKKPQYKVTIQQPIKATSVFV